MGAWYRWVGWVKWAIRVGTGASQSGSALRRGAPVGAGAAQKGGFIRGKGLTRDDGCLEGHGMQGTQRVACALACWLK